MNDGSYIKNNDKVKLFHLLTGKYINLNDFNNFD